MYEYLSQKCKIYGLVLSVRRRQQRRRPPTSPPQCPHIIMVRQATDDPFIYSLNQVQSMHSTLPFDFCRQTVKWNWFGSIVSPFKMLSNCDNRNLQITQSRSPSSEEDNSPTELNNCRRLIDKPPLVKSKIRIISNCFCDNREISHKN